MFIRRALFGKLIFVKTFNFHHISAKIKKVGSGFFTKIKKNYIEQ